jgi:hypothetical protein
MGYTHYWKFKQQPSAQKFAEFVEGVKHITATADEAGIALSEEVYKPSHVSFNGVGAEAHETFYIELPVDDERYDYGFCKTAEKPYDMVVTASLILAKKIFGEDIEIKSDGNWDDWQSGQLLYESVYDIQPENVLVKVNA